MNDDYYKGMSYFFDRSSSTPSLLQIARKGHFAIPFQILFQDLSAILLRTIFYYFLAEASAQVLGFWLPSLLIAAYSILHSLFVLVPKNHQHYLNDMKAVTDSTQEEIAQLCEKYKVNHSCLSLLQASLLNILLLLSRAATGGWIGWKLAELVNDKTHTEPIIQYLVTASSVITIAALLSCLRYRADAECLRYQLVNEKIQTEKRAIESETKPEMQTAPTNAKKTVCESFFDKAAFFINVVNSISIAASNTGLIERFLHLEEGLLRFEVLLALGMLISIDAAISRGIYYQDKIEDTARRVFVPNSCSSAPSEQKGLYEKARDTTRKIFGSCSCLLFQAKRTQTILPSNQTLAPIETDILIEQGARQSINKLY